MCPYTSIDTLADNWVIPADNRGHDFVTEYRQQREHDCPTSDSWISNDAAPIEPELAQTE